MAGQKRTFDFSVQVDTARELLERWDAGNICWTIELGGLSPGYEQSIHIMVFEFLRDFVNVESWNDITPEAIEERRDAVYDRTFGGKDYGHSGAQVGAATSLAIQLARVGPRATMEAVDDESRFMQISRDFPKAPEVP